MQTGAATLENSMDVPQKVKNRTTLQSSNQTAGHLPREYKNTNSKGYMHPYVYSSNVHNRQTMERARCPLTNEWIEELCYRYIQWNVTQPSKK